MPQTERERLTYQLCTAPCSTRYFLSLEKSSVGGMVHVSDVTIWGRETLKMNVNRDSEGLAGTDCL